MNKPKKLKLYPYTGLDYVGSRDDSEKLAQEIRSYWRKRGREIFIWVERELWSEIQGKKRYYYTIRSNLTEDQ